MGRPKGSSNKVKETSVDVVPENLPSLDENVIYIDDLKTVKMVVEAENAERKLNPSVVQDGEAGINFINGEPHMVIDNQYVPHDEAQIILQTRKVVREWIKLENLKKGIKD